MHLRTPQRCSIVLNIEVWGLCRQLQKLNLVLLKALFGLSAGVLGVVVLLENDMFDVVVSMVEGIA